MLFRSDRAETLARTITHPYHQGRALTELITVIAQAGDPDHAETLARTITSPDDQARAFTGLASVVAQAGEADRAGRLLARALIMDLPEIWWVRAVSDFFPSAIGCAWDVLADAYAIRT